MFSPLPCSGHAGGCTWCSLFVRAELCLQLGLIRRLGGLSMLSLSVTPGKEKGGHSHFDSYRDTHKSWYAQWHSCAGNKA